MTKLEDQLIDTKQVYNLLNRLGDSIESLDEKIIFERFMAKLSDSSNFSSLIYRKFKLFRFNELKKVLQKIPEVLPGECIDRDVFYCIKYVDEYSNQMWKIYDFNDKLLLDKINEEVLKNIIIDPNVISRIMTTRSYKN